MIIGDGDIATILPDRKDLLFFASGVSNSQEERMEEFDREHKLIFEQDRKQHIVYFSSLSVFYSNTPYAWHKKRMEFLIKSFPKHTIIRIGNITWGKNPHTIINFFKGKIERNEPYTVKDGYRYLVDLEEFLHWINLIPDWTCEMNITGELTKIKDIVKMIKDGRWRDYDN